MEGGKQAESRGDTKSVDDGRGTDAGFADDGGEHRNGRPLYDCI
jgi:hypothetical protein